ncbi:MAG: phosphatidate cytidylyltransferase [Spirochaetales bacterium]|nr:phosphatidate cytidylyltransferase [Spirochaetales bacterium]
MIRGEIIRKLIHFMIAFVPLLAMINKPMTFMILGTGIFFYIIVETLRLQGRNVILISNITEMSARDRDRGKFVLGPVTLALGAMLALTLYPEPAGRIAIYALAFGDGFASLAGKLTGWIKLPFTRGKTLAGFLACFFVVFIISFRILGNPLFALLIAATAAILEVLPTDDFDNILIPLGTGLVTALLVGAL